MSMFTCRNCGYTGKWPGTRCPRCCQAQRLDAFAIVASALVAAVLLWLPAAANTCPGCMPEAPEPPPIAGVACPAVPPVVDGCVDHVYLPMVKGE